MSDDKTKLVVQQYFVGRWDDDPKKFLVGEEAQAIERMQELFRDNHRKARVIKRTEIVIAENQQ